LNKITITIMIMIIKIVSLLKYYVNVPWKGINNHTILKYKNIKTKYQNKQKDRNNNRKCQFNNSCAGKAYKINKNNKHMPHNPN
jgi:predicted Holliday junction resolvase-like endonuclease